MTQDVKETVESCIKGTEIYINEFCNRKSLNTKGKVDTKEFKKCKDKVNESLLKAVEAGLKKCITTKMNPPERYEKRDQNIDLSKRAGIFDKKEHEKVIGYKTSKEREQEKLIEKMKGKTPTTTIQAELTKE